MAMEKEIKQNVWRSIYRLVVPHKKKFFWVVLLSLLSTGAGLVEPLIYREAINDVAGLFVKQAKDDTKKELGLFTDDEEITDSTTSVAVSKDSVTKEKKTAKP